MATSGHTPAGDYPAHAPVHLLDLEEIADRLIQQLPGHRRQTKNLAREGGVSVIMMAMEAGDAIHEHSAKGAVSVQLLRGYAVLTAAAGSFELRPGQLLLIQPNAVHDLRAQEQSVVILTITSAEADG